MSESVASIDAVEEQSDGLVRERTAMGGYVARQPILDRRGYVFGYELLFRQHSAEEHLACVLNTSHIMLDTLSVFGLNRFTSGSCAFLNCTSEMLVDNLVADLPPSQTVLEISQKAELSSSVLRACRKLKAAGFRIALSEFPTNEVNGFPLELVNYVKVDSNSLETAEWARVCKQLNGTPATVVADKVHTQETYRTARAMGIRFFQGFYFCKPDLVRTGRVPANRLSSIAILRELFKDPLDLKTLCPLVMRDASLVYRVLRLVNSPIYGIRNDVNSIESAMLILGDVTFRRIATLAIHCALNQEQPPEILHMSLVRATFCAKAASLCGLDANEQYLVGMLSLLPAMLQLPMETIVLELPLRTEIQDALLRASIKERCLLSWIESLELNQLAECERLAKVYDLSERKLTEYYLEAIDDAAKMIPTK